MQKLIKIYGERNTNTNYLNKIIGLNLDVKLLPSLAPLLVRRIQRRLPGNEWLVDFYMVNRFSNNLGWKHMCVSNVDRIQNSSLHQNNDISYVTITKNPYSWLLSLHRRPYHQYYRNKPDFLTFLKTPWKTVARDYTAPVIADPIELWNVKNASYANLDVFNAVHITSEQIFKDPKAVISAISKQFSLDCKKVDFVDYERSTKGVKSTGNDYRDYYLNEKWKDELPQEAIDIINAKLDPAIMERFGYQFL